jgi:translation initiation factor IF-2
LIISPQALRKEDRMEEEVGRITHYFSKIGVGVVELTKGTLKVGDTIHVKGHTTDLFQKVDSMQVEHAPVQAAKKGESFGLHVESPVREHDIVFKVTED